MARLRAIHFLLLDVVLMAAGQVTLVPAIDQFQDPPSTSRAKFRYWIPDASIDVPSMQQDISGLASVGGGSFELVPFYSYGNPTGAIPPTDWNFYGFGTKAFQELFDAALESAAENEVLMDFSLGASQGQGTPAELGTAGLAIQLQLGVATVKSGSSFTGPVPGPQNLTGTLLTGGGFMHGLDQAEKGDLKGVIAGRILSESANGSDTINKVTIDEESIIDLLSNVHNDNLDWEVPVGNETWKIFAFWEGYTNQQSCTGGVNGTTTIEKGSLVVDHFSEAGARLHTSFFDQHILSGHLTKKNLRSHGGYAWEDSMELLFVLPWTRGFLERFESAHGYSLMNYLPLLFNKANSWAESYSPYAEEYVYGLYTADGVSIHNANFRETLGKCYEEYLDYHVKWARSHGIEFSTQVSYNMPLSFRNEIPSVDGPEGESLGFEDVLDAYRSLAGPAQLAGKRDISSEVGAISRSSYTQTIPELLRSIEKSYAGGLTMMVIHGMAYSGPYEKTSWPGYQPFSYGTTDSWNRIQPAWQHMKDILGYLGRTQHILKAGKPRVDLAIYQSDSRWTPGQIYKSDNLQEKGFTYNFLGSKNLKLPKASVSNKLLGPDGPGYRALIFLNNAEVDDEVLRKVQDFDRAGLPIFFVGDVQTRLVPSRLNDQSDASAMVDKIIAQGKHIHHVSTNDDLPAALANAGITPRVQISAPNNSILSVYRTEGRSGIDYIWLFNDANTTVSFVADFQVHQEVEPLALNAWTGEIRYVAHYSLSKTGVQVPLELGPYESVIVGLKPLKKDRLSWVTKASGSIEAIGYNSDGKLFASLKGPSTVTVNGTTELTFSVAPPSPSSLRLWDLEIQEWKGDPTNMTSIETQKSIHRFENQPLLPWKDISSTLESVSGIGLYSTYFTAPDVEDLGAYLSVGPIFNTLRAWVNGNQVSPFGADGAKIDISKYIHRGTVNSIQVEVSTTLYNRVRSDLNTTMFMGYPLSLIAPNYASADAQAYGLTGPVVIDWVLNKGLE